MVLKISLPILTFLIAFLGGLSNSFTDWSWYESLEQSSLRPPNYIFGIVWPILRVIHGLCYLLGIAYVRTLAWLGSLGCLIVMGLSLI